ncbi:MAG TPA: flagellar export protein FliJ [Clostridiales bacterium]|nr:flagellar export protein FliJ [Clostridiales bacterium]
MKRFRYSMQNILDYRRNIEEEKKLKFADALNEYMQQKEILCSYEKELSSAYSSKLSRSQHQVYELKNLYQYIHYLKEKIEIQKRLVTEAEKTMESWRQQLISAQKDRKMIEKHKEKALSQYYSELDQAEQKTIDELALYSHMRR